MDEKDPLKHKGIKMADIIELPDGKKALMLNAVEEREEKKVVKKVDMNETIFKMMRQKVDQLLDDYMSYYYPKGGRSIKVTVEIGKETGTDWHSEELEYSDTMRVEHKVRIKS